MTARLQSVIDELDRLSLEELAKVVKALEKKLEHARLLNRIDK